MGEAAWQVWMEGWEDEGRAECKGQELGGRQGVLGWTEVGLWERQVCMEGWEEDGE